MTDMYVFEDLDSPNGFCKATDRPQEVNEEFPGLYDKVAIPEGWEALITTPSWGREAQKRYRMHCPQNEEVLLILLNLEWWEGRPHFAQLNVLLPPSADLAAEVNKALEAEELRCPTKNNPDYAFDKLCGGIFCVRREPLQQAA